MVLSEFTEQDSLNMLKELRERNKKAALEIFKNGRRSLLFIPDHMSLDKENWLIRKRNAVLYFGLSTYDLHKKCDGDESLLETKYGLSLKDVTLVMGSIPLIVEGAGLIGAITVTGLLPEEDHELATELLKRVKDNQGVEETDGNQ